MNYALCIVNCELFYFLLSSFPARLASSVGPISSKRAGMLMAVMNIFCNFVAQYNKMIIKN